MLSGKLIIFSLLVFSIDGGSIDSNLQRKCRRSPSQNVDIILELPSVDSSIPPSVFTGNDIAEKLRGSLQSLSAASQASIIAGVKAIDPNLEVQEFWIVNRIAIKNVPCNKVSQIAAIAGDFVVRGEEIATIQSTGPVRVLAEGSVSSSATVTPQWGVQKINAPGVWSRTRGAGVVVANIDSGVRGSHEALAATHRGEFGWLDGFTNSSAGEPNDDNGHGTHTMGSMCGGQGVGVAPDATWIACKACNAQGSCTESALLTCGQWVYCPYTVNSNKETTVDCSKRPRIVSNSWGGLGSSGNYNGVIDKWQKVNIIPVFAIGNDGPACLTTGSPGNQANVIGVAATDRNDALADFSSRGPYAALGVTKIKPEIAAPGSNIISSWRTSDTAYAEISGTSMATPHVAGAAALLLADNNSLTYSQVLKTLSDTAFRPRLSIFDGVSTCSCSIFFLSVCIPRTPGYPNNGYGNGRIDVQTAFQTLS